jgi:hypothetical protein
VKVNALVDAVILKRADELEPGAVAHMRQPRVPMASEVALTDQPVRGAIKHRAPLFELADALRRLLRVELGHSPLVQELSTAHGVAKMDLPVVAAVDVSERRGHAALGHDRVCLTKKALGDDARVESACATFDRRTETRSACTDDEHVVFESLNLADVH